jgi:hypothetical protein
VDPRTGLDDVEKERQQQQQQQQRRQHAEVRGVSVASMIWDCSNTGTVDRNHVQGSARAFLLSVVLNVQNFEMADASFEESFQSFEKIQSFRILYGIGQIA